MCISFLHYLMKQVTYGEMFLLSDCIDLADGRASPWHTSCFMCFDGKKSQYVIKTKTILLNGELC